MHAGHRTLLIAVERDFQEIHLSGNQAFSVIGRNPELIK
jgi:hypothetical protein